MKILKNFKYAFNGILHCISTEKNFRIHTVFALYVLFFLHVLKENIQNTIFAIIAIALVLGSELYNTVLENICDLYSTEKNEKIKVTKDMSAGAVLIFSIAALLIGSIIFFNKENFCFLIFNFFSNPQNTIFFVVSLILSILYIKITPSFLKKMRGGKN